MPKGPTHARGPTGGFTMVELLIVIVILGIIAAIVVFGIGTTAKNAVAASCSADASSVAAALSAYDAQMGAFPSDLGALVDGTTATGGESVGPWLRGMPTSDHYVLLNDSAGHLYVVPSGEISATVGGIASVGDITATVSPGGTFDFDTDPAICGQYS